MKQRFSSIEKMLLLSVAFTMLLLAVRIIKMHELVYGFYIWNTFLAIIPLFFSRRLLRQEKFNKKSIALIAGWLLFLPNAPYIITDLIHFENDVTTVRWYDILLVMSGTWNGLMLGLISLMQVEKFLSQHIKPGLVKVSVFASVLLCSYGVYLGRFLRFNSWDIFTNPKGLVFELGHQTLHPFHYSKTWVFTLLFSVMLSIIYFTIKQLPKLFEENFTNKNIS
jgi:uncharacterized membrane protein